MSIIGCTCALGVYTSGKDHDPDCVFKKRAPVVDTPVVANPKHYAFEQVVNKGGGAWGYRPTEVEYRVYHTSSRYVTWATCDDPTHAQKIVDALNHSCIEQELRGQ